MALLSQVRLPSAVPVSALHKPLKQSIQEWNFPDHELADELADQRESCHDHSLEAKVAALEAELRQWDADSGRLSRLVSWSWIMKTLHQLPRSQPFVA